MGDGHCIRICTNKKIGGFITPAIKYANSTYDEKVATATICDACHADRSVGKSGTARPGSIFLEN